MDPGMDDWNVKYSYDGTDYSCNGNKCQHYDSEAGTVFPAEMSWHVGEFDC